MSHDIAMCCGTLCDRNANLAYVQKLEPSDGEGYAPDLDPGALLEQQVAIEKQFSSRRRP